MNQLANFIAASAFAIICVAGAVILLAMAHNIYKTTKRENQ